MQWKAHVWNTTEVATQLVSINVREFLPSGFEADWES